MNVFDAIENRRSIFPNLFTGEAIDDSRVLKLLNAANQAPNHRNTEPWRFIVFGEESKLDLATYLQTFYKEHTPTEKYKDLKYHKISKKVTSSSHIIAICYELSGQVPEWEELAATACAVQNLWLAATADGLGGYWSSPKSMSEAGEFLDLPDNQKCIGLFYLGVPMAGRPPKKEKGNILEKIIWKK